jgi:hypothetical protein
VDGLRRREHPGNGAIEKVDRFEWDESSGDPGQGRELRQFWGQDTAAEGPCESTRHETEPEAASRRVVLGEAEGGLTDPESLAVPFTGRLSAESVMGFDLGVVGKSGVESPNEWRGGAKGRPRGSLVPEPLDEGDGAGSAEGSESVSDT